MTRVCKLDGAAPPPLTRREFIHSGTAALALSAVALPAASMLFADETMTHKGATGTGYIFDDRYIAHVLEKNHPECPDRLKGIRKRMTESGLLKDVTLLDVGAADALPPIRKVHPKKHIDLVAKQARDESICRLAVAGALTAVDAVCGGKVRNSFCAVRPPGHHAEDFGQFGFCFYNNVAVAARYAQVKYKLKNILIADWDYHHGNGTQWAFYDDPSVLFFSTHALYAFPPKTGSENETGAGKGKGFNINVPLPRGATDAQMLTAFEKKLIAAADRFKPDLVLISAGFDSRKDDLLGDFAVTDDGFRKLTAMMMDIAKRHCDGRLVSILEGGYNIDGLARAVEAHVSTLLA